MNPYQGSNLGTLGERPRRPKAGGSTSTLGECPAAACATEAVAQSQLVTELRDRGLVLSWRESH